MTREEILSKKKDGDWQTVGLMLGCTSECARFRFRRQKSKFYPAVLEAIIKVIEAREKLIEPQESVELENK